MKRRRTPTQVLLPFAAAQVAQPVTGFAYVRLVREYGSEVRLEFRSSAATGIERRDVHPDPDADALTDERLRAWACSQLSIDVCHGSEIEIVEL